MGLCPIPFASKAKIQGPEGQQRMYLGALLSVLLNKLITPLKLVIQVYFEHQGFCDKIAISWLISCQVFH